MTSVVLLRFSPLLAQVELKYFRTETVPNEARMLFDESGMKGFWTMEQLHLYGKRHAADMQRIFNVIPLGPLMDEAFLIIEDLADESDNQSITMTLLTDMGTHSTSWTVPHHRDRGLPHITALRDKILLSYPEDQRIAIRDMSGQLTMNISLFEESSWSHEKMLRVFSTGEDHFLAAGMTSADLRESKNVIVFEGLPGREPIRLRSLPMTVLYDLAASGTGIVAVAGTVSPDGAYSHEPKLILFRKDATGTQEFPLLPRNMLWHGNLLYAADKRQFLALSYDEPEPVIQIDLGRKIIPLELFRAGESVCLLYAEGTYYQQGTPLFSRPTLFVFNPRNGSRENLLLSKTSHKILRVSMLFDEHFFIQLDQQLLKLGIR